MHFSKRTFSILFVHLYLFYDVQIYQEFELKTVSYMDVICIGSYLLTLLCYFVSMYSWKRRLVTLEENETRLSDITVLNLHGNHKLHGHVITFAIF